MTMRVDRGKVEILFRSSANEQQFVVVYGDGRLVHLIENDGYRFLKHGAEKEGTAIAVDDVAKLGGAKLVAEVQQARNLLRPVNVGPANTDGHEARFPARL
jgi:hypothetical protein